jgi:DNA-3-methyladenine glycosylase II
MSVFTAEQLPKICHALARKHSIFQNIIRQYGCPPFWQRPNNFASLIHIILEQQVSLASAKSAFDQLKKKLGTITPQKLLQLSDEELKACYFSRQKKVYARCLAQAIVDGQINLKSFETATQESIAGQLVAIKGIGRWTIEVYLLMVLHHSNIFPLGDIALINSMKHELNLPATTSKETLAKIVADWQPHLSVAAFLLWWAYIKRKGIASP